ncbi:aldo/keto reductase [Croceiramulus getboli]|nr:aldo/keto reductase [Flavobacteriaceae bacterium YJPT1-3]
MKPITDIQGRWKLNNGVDMPYLGLGVYQADDGQEVVDAIQYALDAGYRNIDTASIYKNEEGVGQGFRESGYAREDVFITSKVWNTDQGYNNTLDAFEASLERLQLDYLDLYLIHWPVSGKYKDTWRALEHLYKEEKVRAIGVSNFMQDHLEDLLSTATIIPMVNQLEFHPFLVQQSLIDYCHAHKIQYQAWSPLMQGKAFHQDAFDAIAKQYDTSVAQLILRWSLQKGVMSIPKSTNKKHIESNADLFDFEISEADMQRLDAMDRGERTGPDPHNFDF